MNLEEIDFFFAKKITGVRSVELWSLVSTKR